MAPVRQKEEIDFVRSNGKILGNICNACPRIKSLADEEMALLIDVDSAAIVLCAYHEGMLLERLLTNYLKRLKRKSKIGFLSPIPKEEEKVNG